MPKLLDPSQIAQAYQKAAGLATCMMIAGSVEYLYRGFVHLYDTIKKDELPAVGGYATMQEDAEDIRADCLDFLLNNGVPKSDDKSPFSLLHENVTNGHFATLSDSSQRALASLFVQLCGWMITAMGNSKPAFGLLNFLSEKIENYETAMRPVD
jgi:hypothetical protein